MRRGAARWMIVASAAWGALSCASSGPGAVPGVEHLEPGSSESTEIDQSIFRVRYRGGDGRGRIRLTLRQSSESRFQMAAADTFGRPVWSFDRVGDSSTFIDHRQRSVCRFEGEVVVNAIALRDLPVRMLPRVLDGSLPTRPVDDAVSRELDSLREASGPGGEIDFLDDAGRRWTARFENGLRSWTLWDEDRPLLWWRREDKGGILSHRDGAQALWVRTASERATGSLPGIEVPVEYAAGACDD